MTKNAEETPALTLGTLREADYNPREMSPDERAALGGSMEAFGDLSGIVFNLETGNLVSGHQRVRGLRGRYGDGLDLETLYELPEPGPYGDVARGVFRCPDGADWPVRLVRWPMGKEKAANLAANARTAQGSFTDAAIDLLDEVRVEMPRIAEVMRFDEIRASLDPGGGGGGEDAGEDLDRNANAQFNEGEEAESKPGEVYELGPHRLVCGDCHDEEAMATFLEGVEVQAVVTDPPYAVFGSSTGIAEDITDDRVVRPFFVATMRLILRALPWFGHAYVFCDWRTWPAIWQAAKDVRLKASNCIVWDKGGQGLGSMYANCHEFTGFFVKTPPPTAMGDRPSGQRLVYRPNHFTFSLVLGEDRLHNAAKPVELLREYIRNSTDEGDVVLDPFGGSGSTLIAAALEGRVCYLVDVEPRWADVVRRRWAKLARARGWEEGEGAMEPRELDGIQAETNKATGRASRRRSRTRKSGRKAKTT